VHLNEQAHILYERFSKSLLVVRKIYKSYFFKVLVLVTPCLQRKGLCAGRALLIVQPGTEAQ
ncbi:hypothetical protein, partial [Hydrotalea sp. AMD]|uniref:hypothetical protein n=1 Tax=Hydrotalea sp. AMD TaxID=2501297 RepID=UPI00257BAEA0